MRHHGTKPWKLFWLITHRPHQTTLRTAHTVLVPPQKHESGLNYRRDKLSLELANHAACKLLVMEEKRPLYVRIQAVRVPTFISCTFLSPVCYFAFVVLCPCGGAQKGSGKEKQGVKLRNNHNYLKERKGLWLVGVTALGVRMGRAEVDSN